MLTLLTYGLVFGAGYAVGAGHFREWLATAWDWISARVG